MNEPMIHTEIGRSIAIASLGEVISFLKSSGAEKGESGIRVFEIDPSKKPIEAIDLKQLLAFPFEFSIHEDQGKLKVATGNKDHPADPYDIGVPEDTLLYIHTHPQASSNTFISFADIFVADHLGSRVQQILVTKAGVIVYKRPEFDPIRNIPTDEAARELMAQWGNQRDIDFFGFKSSNFFVLPDEEIMQIARDFTEDTKMVVREVSWEDMEGINEILNAINLKATISNNEARGPLSVLDELGINLGLIIAPQKPTIEVIANHIDSIKYKKGVLLRDRDMRQSWKNFAVKLVDKELKTRPSALIKDLLLKLREKAEALNID